MRHLTLLLALVACGGEVTDFNGYRALDGELTYTETLEDGQVVCDVDLALVGRPYTANCNGCEFAFHVDPEVIEDRSSEDCVLPSIWTYFDDELATDVGLGWAEAATDFDGNPVDDALMVVGNYQGTRAMAVALAGAEEANTSIDWDGEANLGWEATRTAGYGDPVLLQVCEGGWDGGSFDGNRSDGAYRGTGELGCDGLVADVWTFEARAGEPVKITMDTVAADSAFDAVYYLNDPSGCTIGGSDDAFQCTFRPLDYKCPGGKFVPEVSGTYELVAYSYDQCTAADLDRDGYGDIAEYSLSIDADYDPNLTLVDDDAPYYPHVSTVQVRGAAEVSR
ncbi:MAG: hypothetical protein EP330_30245 [Deltaproteobacteria bacterium]|nr:MAG: hypothetical protein EP330_30245 [Deltaproteobacteria bacterium]